LSDDDIIFFLSTHLNNNKGENKCKKHENDFLKERRERERETDVFPFSFFKTETQGKTETKKKAHI